MTSAGPLVNATPNSTPWDPELDMFHCHDEIACSGKRPSASHRVTIHGGNRQAIQARDLIK
jgi:hypothetical protein